MGAANPNTNTALMIHQCAANLTASLLGGPRESAGRADFSAAGPHPTTTWLAGGPGRHGPTAT
jgi:hypothetical protein